MKRQVFFMFYNAVNGSIPIADTTMDYISFGIGHKHLIMIPGLGEGLTTVKGTAIPMALMYRKLAKDFRVHVFSRRTDMPDPFTTRDMAEDIYTAMQQLGIPSANIIGVSLGGMIVQHLAIDHPEVVEKLILCVTLPCPNPTLVKCLSGWSDMAKRNNFKGILVDTALNSYTDSYLRKRMWFYRIFAGLFRSKHAARFITMAEAGMTHTALSGLEKISCPTLIIGGRLDKIVTGEASEHLHRLIPKSELCMYEDYGHGLYEETPDFLQKVKEFFI